MKVLIQGTMPNGTPIQIEEWHEDYSFIPYASTLASYPKSKMSHDGAYAPKGNEKYRFSFDFSSETEARTAYDDLLSGSKKLIDFVSNISDKRYSNCI